MILPPALCTTQRVITYLISQGIEIVKGLIQYLRLSFLDTNQLGGVFLFEFFCITHVRVVQTTFCGGRRRYGRFKAFGTKQAHGLLDHGWWYDSAVVAGSRRGRGGGARAISSRSHCPPRLFDRRSGLIVVDVLMAVLIAFAGTGRTHPT
eukprot:scaffold1221_cov207-Amphora_coffeaeformis.AAC.22